MSPPVKRSGPGGSPTHAVDGALRASRKPAGDITLRGEPGANPVPSSHLTASAGEAVSRASLIESNPREYRDASRSQE